MYVLKKNCSDSRGKTPRGGEEEKRRVYESWRQRILWTDHVQKEKHERKKAKGLGFNVRLGEKGKDYLPLSKNDLKKDYGAI